MRAVFCCFKLTFAACKRDLFSVYGNLADAGAYSRVVLDIKLYLNRLIYPCGGIIEFFINDLGIGLIYKYSGGGFELGNITENVSCYYRICSVLPYRELVTVRSFFDVGRVCFVSVLIVLDGSYVNGRILSAKVISTSVFTQLCLPLSS